MSYLPPEIWDKILDLTSRDANFPIFREVCRQWNDICSRNMRELSQNLTLNYGACNIIFRDLCGVPLIYGYHSTIIKSLNLILTCQKVKISMKLHQNQNIILNLNNPKKIKGVIIEFPNTIIGFGYFDDKYRLTKGVIVCKGKTAIIKEVDYHTHRKERRKSVLTDFHFTGVKYDRYEGQKYYKIYSQVTIEKRVGGSVIVKRPNYSIKIEKGKLYLSAGRGLTKLTDGDEMKLDVSVPQPKYVERWRVRSKDPLKFVFNDTPFYDRIKPEGYLIKLKPKPHLTCGLFGDV